MPTTIILVMPLCTGPLKQVCSFTRLSTSTPAASNEWRSIQTSPVATWPTLTHSMLERIGMPIASSVMPSDSTIARCPSAVAPLWEPMAGTMNGSAPCSRSQSPAVRVTRAMLSIPRLPAVMATGPWGTAWPLATRLSSCWQTSAATSTSGLETSRW